MDSVVSVANTISCSIVGHFFSMAQKLVVFIMGFTSMNFHMNNPVILILSAILAFSFLWGISSIPAMFISNTGATILLVGILVSSAIGIYMDSGKRFDEISNLYGLGSKFQNS